MGRNTFRKHPVLWVVSVVVLAPVLLLVGVHVANNIAAKSIESRLVSIGVPPETELIDSAWAVSRFAGAGNGTEYAGSLLLESDLSAADLEAFYESQSPHAQVVMAWGEDMASHFQFNMNYDLEKPGLYMVFETGHPTSSLLSSADIRGH